MFARIVCIAREYVSCCASFAHTQHTAFVFAICYFFIYIFFCYRMGMRFDSDSNTVHAQTQ